jgi:hypothetical protein
MKVVLWALNELTNHPPPRPKDSSLFFSDVTFFAGAQDF